MKSCPSHCETSATRQSLRKLRRERIRQGRAPAGFASKPLQEYSFKNLETLLLEPLKTTKTCLSHCETSATRQSVRKLRRERIRKGRAPAGFASKPLQECSLNENVLQPLRRSATRQSVRKLRRERIRKGRSPAGFASKPLQECSLKNLETLLLEPLKTMKSCPIKTMKACLSHCETSATRQSLRKLASGAHPKRQSPSRFCVQAIAGVQPQKSRNVAFGTPKNNEIVPQPLRNFRHQKPKKAASGAHPKRQSPSRFCSATRQSLRKLRRERIRKGRAPAGFASKPLRNCNLKNLETLFLEPLKTMKSCPSHCETAATDKAQEGCVGSASEKRCVWNP